MTTDEHGKPSFIIRWQNPASLAAIDDTDAPLGYQIDLKIGGGKWDSEDHGDLITGNSLHSGDELITHAPFAAEDIGEGEEINIQANTYYFRVRYSYYWQDGAGDHYIYSPFSSVVSVGTEAYSYKGASNWAVAELDKALQYGLITKRIADNMAANITREGSTRS